MAPLFSKGDQVLRKSHRDQIGYIADDPKLIAGEYWYMVQFAGGAAKRVQESDLELYSGLQDVWSLLKRRSFADKEAFSKLVTFTKLQSPLRTSVYALNSSRTIFYPYCIASAGK